MVRAWMGKGLRDAPGCERVAEVGRDPEGLEPSPPAACVAVPAGVSIDVKLLLFLVEWHVLGVARTSTQRTTPSTRTGQQRKPTCGRAPAADPSSGGVAVLDTTGNMLATQGRSTPRAVPGSSRSIGAAPGDGPGRRPPRHLRRPAGGRAPPRGRAPAGRWPSPPATTGTREPERARMRPTARAAPGDSGLGGDLAIGHDVPRRRPSSTRSTAASNGSPRCRAATHAHRYPPGLRPRPITVGRAGARAAGAGSLRSPH